MPRPGTFRSPQGLLLVEAVLAAAAVAVGLVAISRGLSGQLQALRQLEAHEQVVTQVQALVAEFEARGAGGRRLPAAASGAVEDAADTTWSVHAARRADLPDAAGDPLAADVQVEVNRQERPRITIRVSPVWPVNWIPETWL